ncbi:uncharacterized protein PAC_18885 [Phialocephala subalpina]|uniref:Disease resistance R13L4/SHOC-2-like LRR domain-containing protein n=1 Tax=Phialocephala subalpina TaxID=576137 RepID=A0A1L7XVA9_9HELO|nr:uncharacterized protein PAC_18885 [Phialocephala subalpina]
MKPFSSSVSLFITFNHEMSDPLSIAVAVASLVATAAKLLNAVNSYRSQYNLQDLSAISIRVQCDCILVALAQIQAVLQCNQQVAARLMCEDNFSGQRLKDVLGACELTFAVLVGRLSKLTGTLDNGGGLLSRREKIERLWKESEIMELSQNISRISDGLNLLLTAFNMKSQLEVQRVFTTSRASILLDRLADDASSIFLSDCNASYISETMALREQDPMSHTEIDPKDFSFDQEVLMTPAYRKVQISHPRSRESPASPEPFSGQNAPNRGHAAKAISRKPVPPRCKIAATHTNETSQIMSQESTLVMDGNSKAAITSCQPVVQLGMSGPTSKIYQILPIFHTTELVSLEPDAALQTNPVEVEEALQVTLPVTRMTESDDGAGESGLEPSEQTVKSNDTIECPGITQEVAFPLGHFNEPTLASDQEYPSHLEQPSKKVTLWDLMPEFSRPPSKDSSAQLVPLSHHRYKVHVTPIETNISHMGLTDLTDDAVNLVQDTIKSLFLYGNSLSALPKSITMCRNLTYLNLKENSLEKFPPEICAIRSLKTLHVSQNTITKLPSDFSNLHNLEVLDIATNCLQHLSHFLAMMNKLTIIYAQNNPFTDPSLNEWQQKCSYGGSADYSKAVTQELKALLNVSQLPTTMYSLPILPFQNNEMIDGLDFELAFLPWLRTEHIFENVIGLAL